MPSNHSEPNPDPRVTLALRAHEAAKALGISPRLLATLVAEKRIPYVRINRAVVFPVADLQKWLSQRASKEVSE